MARLDQLWWQGPAKASHAPSLALRVWPFASTRATLWPPGLLNRNTASCANSTAFTAVFPVPSHGLPNTPACADQVPPNCLPIPPPTTPPPTSLTPQVRDVSFSPDNGTISKVEFDDFGLRFLPVNFFDTFSISSELIDSVSMGCVLVATDERQRQEKQGILSSILRGTGTRPVAGLLSDGGYRSEAAGYLPQGYSYEQWQNDIRRWEAETGIRYEEYMSQNAGYGSRAARNALPSRTTASGAASGGPAARYALPAPAGAAPPQAAAAAAGRQWQPNQVAAGYGAQPGQLPGQQQQYGGDPRYRGGAPGGPPGQGRYPGAPPAQQQHQWGAQGPAAPAAPQQQWGQQQPQQQQTPTGWPAPGATPQQPPMQQQQRIQQAGGGPGPMGGGPGAGPRGPGPSPPQQQQQPQLPPQQQQQAYGRPGPDGSARGSMGAGAGTGNGMSSNGANGAMRVDEWLAGSGAREGLEVAGVELNGAGAGAKRPLAEAMGWDGMTAGSSNGRGPSY